MDCISMSCKESDVTKWLSHFLSSLILHNNNEPFLHRIVMCDEKWILYDNQGWPVQWLEGGEAPKHFPKPNLLQKKGHCHCLVVCCPSDPLQFSESQWNHHIGEVCRKLMRCTENCNACSGHWSTQRAHFSTVRPACMSHNQCFKTWRKWTREVLPHPPYSPGLLPTNYHFFKHLNNFLQGKCFNNQQEAEKAFQEFIESWRIFMLQE